MKLTVEEFSASLPLPADEKWKDGVRDIEVFRKKNVSLVFFAPRKTDYQTFHEEDEFYIIAWRQRIEKHKGGKQNQAQ